MKGYFIDTFRFKFKKNKNITVNNISFIRTNFGVIRVLDTGGDKPVFLNVPDGPNVIEHHKEFINNLSDKFRVICFELPGLGFSYPNNKYDYSFPKASYLIIELLDILKIEKAIFGFLVPMDFMQLRLPSYFQKELFGCFYRKHHHYKLCKSGQIILFQKF